MDENIFKVDISQIDTDIADINSQVEALLKQKAIKVELKEYIKKYAIPLNGNPTPKILNVVNSDYGGISEFIKTYISGNPGTHTREIITSYAKSVGKEYDDVSNNISNALSRLKKAGQIRSEARDGGPKAGLNWFIVTKN